MVCTFITSFLTDTTTKTETEFADMEDTTSTPAELDSATVKELDSIIEYIDNNAQKDDFSDLEL